MLKDTVRIADRGIVALRNSDGAELSRREWDDELNKPIIQVKGWVEVVLRENGKIKAKRDGFNIWTNTGREFLALLMSLQTLPSTPFRADSVAYIGVGTGSQVEDPGVLQVAAPAAYTAGLFLAALDVPPTFPLTPTRTTVRYHRVFLETEITIAPGTVNVSEAGLFTNGGPAGSYVPGTRDLTLASAAAQAPVAYKSFEPVGKTNTTQLEVSWEIRF